MNAVLFDNAACKGVDTNVFFPTGSGRNAYVKARGICLRCPVKVECAQYAIESGSKYGMWGGLTKEERKGVNATDKATIEKVIGHGSKAGTTAGYYRERRTKVPICDECRAAYNAAERKRNKARKRAR